MRSTLIEILALSLVLGSLALVAGCGGSRSIGEMSAHELLEEGQSAYQQEKYFRAIELFEACLYNFPGRSFVDTAQYFLALSYFGKGDYEVARVEFNRLTTNYPSSTYFEQSLFMRAVCYFESAPHHYGLDQESVRTAIQQLEDFILDYPESPVVADAQKFLDSARDRLARKRYENGVVYSRMNALESAKIYFQSVIDDFTETEYAPEASYELARIEFKQKHYDVAAEKFENFSIVFADHELVAEARGKAQEALFKDAQAAIEQELWDQAREKLGHLQSSYPGSKWSAKAADLLTRIEPQAPSAASGEDESP